MDRQLLRIVPRTAWEPSLRANVAELATLGQRVTVFEGLVTGMIWIAIHESRKPRHRLVKEFENHERAAAVSLPVVGGVQ